MGEQTGRCRNKVGETTSRRQREEGVRIDGRKEVDDSVSVVSLQGAEWTGASGRTLSTRARDKRVLRRPSKKRTGQ